MDATRFVLLAAKPPSQRLTYQATVLATNPIGYWRFNDPSGTTCTALAGPNGTYVATPTLAQTGAIALDTDKSVTFNGSSQFVDIATSPLNQTDNFSLLFWVKRGDTVDGQVFYGIGTAVKFGTNVVQVEKAGSGILMSSTTTIADTDWHCIAFTRGSASTDHQVYIDGIDVSGTAYAAVGGWPNAAGEAGFMGTWGGWGFLKGSADEFAIWDRGLTPTEVAALYAAGT
jgi:hypothetical protein